MAATSDPTKPLQPLDLVFSCNICHDSIRDICSPLQDEKALDGIRKPVAKLWMTECAHLVCAKHLEGGAPPFHPAGQAPRAVCPVCVGRQNNHALKQMYAISGFAKGEYDPDIPHHFFQCPPVALDTKDGGMDALRFQFLGLVTYGIAIATKFRSLKTAHSHLKDQTEKLRLEKTEAETEIHALTERITLLEEAERRYKANQPEIKHYLQQFTLVKKELDRRNEDLSALGFPPPPIDYTYPPSRLYEDDASNEGHSGYVDRNASDPINVEDQVASVSSTTLRGDSSRDSMRNDRKRQRLSQYQHKPQTTQSPLKDRPAQIRPGIRPPPGSSIAPRIESSRFRPAPAFCQSDNSQTVVAGGRGDTRTSCLATNAQREDWDTWDRNEVKVHSEMSNGTLYMSGALPDNPGSAFRPPIQLKRKIQPVDSIDDISRLDYVGGHDTSSSLRGTQGQYDSYREEAQYSLPARYLGRDYSHNQPFSRPSTGVREVPRAHQIPYRGTNPVSRQSNRPHTPSPQGLNTLRHSDGASVTSPFFRADQTRNQRYHPSSTPVAAPTARQIVSEFRMAPPQRPVQINSRPQPQTMNGLSFVQTPHLRQNRPPAYDFETAFDNQGATDCASRDPHGFFVRPGTQRNSASRYETMHSSRQPSHPQPLPSSTPSLASSINMPLARRRPPHDGALANIRGVKGGSTFSRGMATDLFGSRPGIFSSSRRSIRR